MSVLCALELDVDASEHWYRALEDFAQCCDKQDAACQTLAPMQPYCTLFDRTIDRIHLHVLSAVAMYRKKGERWREELAEALCLAAECRLISDRL